MQLPALTTTELKRYSSSIFAIAKLIKAEGCDNYEFMTDTLYQAYYGINKIVESLEDLYRQDNIKRIKEMEAKK